MLQVLGDFLRILLDVINGVLAANLGRNPELVYALLHRQDVFAQLAGQQGYAELIANLQVRMDGCLHARIACIASAPLRGRGLGAGCAQLGSSCLAPQWELTACVHASGVLVRVRAVQVVIDFFNSRLDSAKASHSAATPEGPPQWDVGQVLEMVSAFSQVRVHGGAHHTRARPAACRKPSLRPLPLLLAPHCSAAAALRQSWRPDKLTPLPELRFVYEEEAAPEEFFVPCVFRGGAVGGRGGCECVR